MTERWLTVRTGVVMNEVLDAAVAAAEPYFAADQVRAEVSSGVRTAESQLETIRRFIERIGLASQHPELATCGVDDLMTLDDGSFYTGTVVAKWQPAWSRLISLYYEGKAPVANPPRDAILLYDAIKNGQNRIGQMIPASGHINGTAFDVVDLKQGRDVSRLAAVAEKIITAHVQAIRSFTPEPINGCVHFNCRT